MKQFLTIFFATVLIGCSFGPAVRETPITYDLGAPRVAATGTKSISASVLVHNVAAPFWLDTPAIVYRLNREAGRQQTYANSRWVASPAALLTQLLRERLAQAGTGGVVSSADGVRADYTLHVELEDFAQVFEQADASHGVVMARASLVNAAQRTLVAQKDFSFEHAAATPDAEGGVRALTEAGNDLINAIVAWAADNIAAAK